MFKKCFLAFLCMGLFQACANIRLRQPTFEEKQHYVFSKNLDPALIDANERGPLNILPYLSEADQVVGETPVDFIRKQKSYVTGDIVRAGYDTQDEGDMALSGEEKGSAVMITILVIVGVVVGAAVPILYLLNILG